MKIVVAKSAAVAGKASCVAVLWTTRAREGQWLPAALRELAQGPVTAGAFRGKSGASATTYQGKQKLVLVGLGDVGEVTLETLRCGAGQAVREAGSRRLTLAIPDVGPEDGDRLQAIAEGIELGAYRFRGQKSEKSEEVIPAEVTLLLEGKVPARAAARIRRGKIAAEAQCLARDLGNQPGNIATATYLAGQARKIARAGGLRCKVVTSAELKKRGFGGILGVNAGSAQAPAFIEMEYRPKSYRKTVCIVGKGITFDTGGISIKPAAGMEEMKYDMCGAAAVLGTLRAVAALKPKVRLYGLVAAAENMPGGRAIKPGDILTTYGGVTVEVNNTDAEGRLVLADALGRAQELKPDYTIDLATLTGACVVALGHRATGLMASSDDISDRLVQAGKTSGERVWPLPLWKEYLEDMQSTVADLKNIGTRWAGALTAGAFLQKMAGDLNFAHLDIAGTAWDTPKTPLYQTGATGVGVRLLLEFLQSVE